MNMAGATSTTRKIFPSSQSETAELPQTTPDQPLIRTRAKTPPRGLPPNEVNISRCPSLSKEDNMEGG